MNWDLNGQSADIEQALAGGAPQRVGWFRFYFSDQRWEWSDQVQRIHGYEPGTVTPTTELVLSHKHPDDRGHVQDLQDRALLSKSSFSSRHRFIDTAGTVHDAIVVADRMSDESGAVVGTAGYYLDLTATIVEVCIGNNRVASHKRSRVRNGFTTVRPPESSTTFGRSASV